MNAAELSTLLILIALCMALALVGAYFLGYSRGAKWEPEYEDPTPMQFTDPAIEVIEDIEVVIQTGYLDQTTGPIAITTQTESIGTISVGPSELDKLREKLARSERLRKRYLRLLREERAMMLSYFTPGHEVKLSTYWHRWVKQRMRIVDEAFAAASWGGPEFANRG